MLLCSVCVLATAREPLKHIQQCSLVIADLCVLIIFVHIRARSVSTNGSFIVNVMFDCMKSPDSGEVGINQSRLCMAYRAQ